MSDNLVEKVAAALYLDSLDGSKHCLSWRELIAEHGDDYEGVARYRKRARAARRVVREALAS